MTNPTSNFGWQMPTSTDLVTDLPADFETFGQAVDTSMADLKGGTTGQILSKATDANMDFVWITNDVGDITAVTAGTGISGGGTSGAVTVTNSMATTITTKGDLVPGTGAGTFARLAAGNNGETLVADSSTSTGLRWQGNYAAAKNQCLNSDFRIWQRGTSFAANVYTADRWKTQSDKTITVSQQTFTPGTAPVAGYEGQFFLRQAYSSGGSYGALQTRLEDVRLFAGQTMTFSYWAKADATISNTPSINQNFGSGGSTQVSTNGTTHNITTTWTRYSSTISVPSISGKTIGTSSYFELQPILLVSGSASTIDIWGVQVEIGSVATAFQTATGTIQGETYACQYYFKRVQPSAAYAGPFGFGYSNTTTQARIQLNGFSQQMRTSPSVTFSTASNFAVLNAAGNQVATATSSLAVTPWGATATITTGAATQTAGQGVLLADNGTTSATIDFSAEL